METIQEYFERAGTPAPGSPVGALMLRVLEKNSGMEFEHARAETHTCSSILTDFSQDLASTRKRRDVARLQFESPRIVTNSFLKASRVPESLCASTVGRRIFGMAGEVVREERNCILILFGQSPHRA